MAKKTRKEYVPNFEINKRLDGTYALLEKFYSPGAFSSGFNYTRPMVVRGDGHGVTYSSPEEALKAVYEEAAKRHLADLYKEEGYTYE